MSTFKNVTLSELDNSRAGSGVTRGGGGPPRVTPTLVTPLRAGGRDVLAAEQIDQQQS